jgi:hypothetical protein
MRLFFDLAERQLDSERRALADDAFHSNPSVMLFDDLPADAQTQPGPAVTILVRFLGRVERLEDHAKLLGRYADAGIGDANFGHAGGAILSHINRQSSAARHRLPSIDHEVHEDLPDLAGHDRNDRPRVNARFDLDSMFGQVFFGQSQRFLDQASQIGRGALRAVGTGVAEHATDDARGALTAVQNPFERLDPRGVIRRRAHAEFGVVDDRGQNVVEFVSDAGRERPDTAQPLSLEKLLSQLIGFDVRSQHAAASHEQVSAALAGVARREHAQRPPLAIGIGCAGAPSSLKGTIDEKPMEFAGLRAAGCYQFAL